MIIRLGVQTTVNSITRKLNILIATHNWDITSGYSQHEWWNSLI